VMVVQELKVGFIGKLFFTNGVFIHQANRACQIMMARQSIDFYRGE
jgi:hypothetical protein